jgi:glycosyltransferase involved in cell wall biosynthesis
MRSRVRILQVVTRLGMGGAERVAETLAAGLVARGHEVTFAPIAGVRDRAVADHMRANLVARGVTVDAAASTSNAKLAVAEAALRLARTVDRARPDLVHLHTEIPEFGWALAGLGSRRVRGLPVVRTVHNTVLWGGWGRAGQFAEGRLEAARVAAVSEAARAAFADWRTTAKRAPAEAVVIYNGIEVAGLPDGPGAPHDPPVLGFAGRFERQKGVDVLLDSLAGLLDGGPRFRVEIHGDGSLAGDVAQAAARWPGRVTVGPPVADLRSRLDAFDAILMPSRFEGMPLLAIEALSAGIPLLATDAPGLDEVLPADYPGRCPPGDPAAYAAVIRDFLDHRPAWREKAIAAQPGTRSRFSLGAMLDSYERLYAELLS